MSTAAALKRSTTDIRHPLQQAVLVQRVLDYIGPGRWCFVAEVSSMWRECYARVASREMQALASGEASGVISCVPQMTLSSEVFATPSQVRYAAGRGLCLATDVCLYAAGMHADIATLQAARETGMPYTYRSIDGAVRCNKLATVQFFRAQGCPWGYSVFNLAAARGHTAMCAYLHAERCPWSSDTCAAAAVNGHDSTLRWLREHGCPWNAAKIHTAAAQGGSAEALECLQQQGIELAADMLKEMLNIAGVHNRLAAAKWLRQQGLQFYAGSGTGGKMTL
jgi:hypothetical protein